MRRVLFGKTGREISAIVFGCMSLKPDNPEAGKRAVARALELGINAFDNADVYARGESERIMGEALREAGADRDDLFITSKCGIVFQGMEPAYEFKAYDLSADYVKRSCEASLKRAGLDYFDLYQPHRIDYLAHPEETAGALEELKDEGKIRHVGLSNYSVEEVRAFAAYGRAESLQLPLSLLHLEVIENGLTALCHEMKMSVLAYSPLHRGVLTAKKARSHSDWQEQREQGVVAQVAEMAERYGATPGQISLAWMMQMPGGVFPLVGTANPDHIAEAAGAADITLDRDDWYELMTIARGRPMPWYQAPFFYPKER